MRQHFPLPPILKLDTLDIGFLRYNYKPAERLDFVDSMAILESFILSDNIY